MLVELKYGNYNKGQRNCTNRSASGKLNMCTKLHVFIKHTRAQCSVFFSKFIRWIHPCTNPDIFYRCSGDACQFTRFVSSVNIIPCQESTSYFKLRPWFQAVTNLKKHYERQEKKFTTGMYYAHISLLQSKCSLCHLLSLSPAKNHFFPMHPHFKILRLSLCSSHMKHIGYASKWNGCC